MSASPSVLAALGLVRVTTTKTKVRHRKLHEDVLPLFLKEAAKRASLVPYETLAQKSGMTLGSVQQTMAAMVREIRNRQPVVHRGAKVLELEEQISEMMRNWK